MFDCSVDEHFTLHLPHIELLDALGLRWSASAADYHNASHTLAAFDPTAHEIGPTALLVSKEQIEKHLEERELVLCWVVFGEKWTIGGRAQSKFRGRLQVSGAFRYTDQGPTGCLGFSVNLPKGVG